MFLARLDRQDVTVPEGVHNVGLLDSTEFLKPQEVEPGKLAAAHVKHLQEHPNDIEVREKLALIYARDFKRLDLATMELTQLINEPKHKPKQVAHWLNMLANCQVELGADMDTVRATLEKIVEHASPICPCPNWRNAAWTAWETSSKDCSRKRASSWAPTSKTSA